MDTAQATMGPNEPNRPSVPFKQPLARQEQALTPTTVADELCDAACPQVAIYRAEHADIGYVTLCGHHYDVSEPKLAALGWTVTQLRERPT